MTPHNNNFDFVRLLAAVSVLISHQFAVNGLPQPGLLGVSLGTLSVQVFFVVSGFLITESWFRDPSVFRFLWRRVLRVWPGLIAMVLLTVLVLGPSMTTWSVRDYFASPQTWAYLKAMKVFALGGPLPGVFNGMPEDGVVNASLWTLPVEVRWYGVLALLGGAGLLARGAVLPLLALAVVLYAQLGVAPGTRADTLVLGQFFLLGGILNRLQPFWAPHANRWMAGAAVLGAALGAAGLWSLAQLVMVPALSLGFGVRATPGLCRSGRYGDFSYGVYIYGFPIQQAVTQRLVHEAGWGFWPGMLCAVGLTGVMAVASWHLVEKRALRLKPRAPRGTAAMPDGVAP